MESDWSQYFCSQPPAVFDKSENHLFFNSELTSNSVRLKSNSNPYCSIWTDAEPTRLQSCNGQSFAMDARMRLDSLKSGCISPVNRPLYNFIRQNNLWESEPEEEESALDLVELLDLEDDVQDEEIWLYESPKKQVCLEESQSALSWCRHVLDNPSPEMVAARRVLINRLDHKSNKCPAVFHHTGTATVGSSIDRTSVNSIQNNFGSLDNKEPSVSHDCITTNYRLQDITDVHIMACLQKASLQQDYVSASAAASPKRSPESPVMLPFYFNTTVKNIDGITPENKTETSSSCCWQPALTSPPCQSPTLVAKHGCQSPKLARLHQQVTQFKLLKRAQNGDKSLDYFAASTGRTMSPLRTSLRSLQAVRNSRSLETDECHPADHLSGDSSTALRLSCWSPLLSAASTNSSGSSHSVIDSSVQTAAIKRLHRSQSLSPCRIPHPVKGYLSAHGQVFASPERSAIVAWARNASSKK
ncbi:hypothetical protein Q5P01_019525 [Channa striata]|uniref:SLAIN motif-containing protein-like n=1 Tax=Channa striata TaxID=64152 RepID=A0AA88S5Y4_CHASR|nr:hypothetical protein Q5P01_019525 [Channa striata]